jgi:hypothetical protein
MEIGTQIGDCASGESTRVKLREVWYFAVFRVSLRFHILLRKNRVTRDNATSFSNRRDLAVLCVRSIYTFNKRWHLEE